MVTSDVCPSLISSRFCYSIRMFVAQPELPDCCQTHHHQFSVYAHRHFMFHPKHFVVPSFSFFLFRFKFPHLLSPKPNPICNLLRSASASSFPNQSCVTVFTTNHFYQAQPSSSLLPLDATSSSSTILMRQSGVTHSFGFASTKIVLSVRWFLLHLLFFPLFRFGHYLLLQPQIRLLRIFGCHVTPPEQNHLISLSSLSPKTPFRIHFASLRKIQKKFTPSDYIVLYSIKPF